MSRFVAPNSVAENRSLVSRTFFLLTLSVAVCAQIGCVALNIPSHRFSDPDDHGGVLGHWSKTDGVENDEAFVSVKSTEPSGLIYSELGGGTPCNRRIDATAPCSCGHCDYEESGQTLCLDGGPLQSDPFGEYECASDTGKKAESDVPWPRFHPVPTRPVFGPSGL